MTNLEFLHDFSRFVAAFKDEHDACVAPETLCLNAGLSAVQFQWFGKFFHKQAHKDWLEHVCHMTMHRTNSKRYLRISEISLVDLSNTSLLTGLDEFYSGRPAIAAVSSASMPSAAIAAAPPVIDDCPPSPSIAHQPAASVAPCASQPVTNLDMLAHFGDLLLAFKKQRKWSSAKEYVPLVHVTNSEEVSVGLASTSAVRSTRLGWSIRASYQFSAGPVVCG
jgi:hypothetical protein